MKKSKNSIRFGVKTSNCHFVESSKEGYPVGTCIEKFRDKTIYHYPSGKKFVEHKTISQIYGRAYDWRSDG